MRLERDCFSEINYSTNVPSPRIHGGETLVECGKFLAANRMLTYINGAERLGINSHHTLRKDSYMAEKSLTQSEIVTHLANATELTKVQVRGFLEAQAKLAYKNAKNGFTLPGLGKLVLVNRKARMGRNPATGQAIKIPAKRVVKFRVAKVAKEAIGGKSKK